MGWKVVKRDLRKHRDAQKAVILQRFFKSGRGEYGEGDVFLGVAVPVQRKVAREHWKSCSLRDVQVLLDSEVHEDRLTSLFILTHIYNYNSNAGKEKIVRFYIRNARRVNNWDLVDSSAHKILGAYLVDKGDRRALYNLVKSRNLWERRISVIACFAFIARGDFSDVLKICRLLLDDKHDLIHKATGWALREIGKKDLRVLKGFLDKYSDRMPRTMLRYSIERLPAGERKKYLGQY